MAPIDIIILALVALALVAVCLRIRRKGTCGDCAGGAGCANCAAGKRASCPAAKGIDRVAEELSRGVK